jgi:predicted PurR-regulated permease PerM
VDTSLLRDIAHLLAHWVSAQIRISLILSAIYAVGFALLGVPLWPLAALLCGFAHAIPVFGAVVAIGLVAIVTWMARGGYPALGTLGIFAAVSGLEGFYLTPKIMGRRLDISPWYVFFGGILAGSLFGFVGILLAVPVMGVVALVYRHFRERR